MAFTFIQVVIFALLSSGSLCSSSFLGNYLSSNRHSSEGNPFDENPWNRPSGDPEDFRSISAPSLLESGDGDDKPTQRVRVQLYNIANLDDHKRWYFRKFLIAESLDENDADIVVLNEVRMSADNKVNALRDLMSVMGNKWVFSNFYPASETASGNLEGIAILSKFPMFGGERLLKLTPSETDTNQRIAVGVKFELSNGQTVDIIATHLTYDADNQISQVNELKEFMQDLVSGPVFLAGDMNTELDYEMPMKVLTSPSALVTSNQPTLSDVWQVLYPSLDGSTKNTPDSPGRLDRIFSYRASPQAMWRDKCDTVSKVSPSDHCSVVADFYV
mmetsp:Transcript_39020/g.44463  ORF Transcript_39020/g.44463 Transcript_39020/m.44463 type:complete len:331 (-) Transcript_39020:209-1201(-)